ncbi:MAG: DUF1391 domain-containing protein [bacterium]|nr:DUF1391 domain-containing protein [bacterium]
MFACLFCRVFSNQDLTFIGMFFNKGKFFKTF